jgi:hypothetical protein
MKVFTVTAIYYIEGAIDDVAPFTHSYPTREAAVQGAEADAVEEFEFLVDPNDGDVHKFPGLDWNPELTIACGLKDGSTDDYTEYRITETEFQWYRIETEPK